MDIYDKPSKRSFSSSISRLPASWHLVGIERPWWMRSAGEHHRGPGWCGVVGRDPGGHWLFSRASPGFLRVRRKGRIARKVACLPTIESPLQGWGIPHTLTCSTGFIRSLVLISPDSFSTLLLVPDTRAAPNCVSHPHYAVFKLLN